MPDHTRAPRTVDYSTTRSWGHDVTYRPRDGGHTLDGSLWHPTTPRPGDWLILPTRGPYALYRFTDVRSCMDPPDMCHFTAEFVPGRDAPADIPHDTCRMVPHA